MRPSNLSQRLLARTKPVHTIKSDLVGQSLHSGSESEGIVVHLADRTADLEVKKLPIIHEYNLLGMKKHIREKCFTKNLHP